MYDLRKTSNEMHLNWGYLLQYKHAVYVQTCKLFADLERYRREKEAKEMHERWVVVFSCHGFCSPSIDECVQVGPL